MPHTKTTLSMQWKFWRPAEATIWPPFRLPLGHILATIGAHILGNIA